MAIPIASLEDAFQVMLAFLYHADADKNELGDVEEPTHGEILALTAVVQFLHSAGAGEQCVHAARQSRLPLWVKADLMARNATSG